MGVGGFIRGVVIRCPIRGWEKEQDTFPSCRCGVDIRVEATPSPYSLSHTAEEIIAVHEYSGHLLFLWSSSGLPRDRSLSFPNSHPSSIAVLNPPIQATAIKPKRSRSDPITAGILTATKFAHASSPAPAVTSLPAPHPTGPRNARRGTLVHAWELPTMAGEEVTARG